MQELKGLNTTEFYSRFFVETALNKYVDAGAEQVKALNGVGEKFLTRFHNVHKMTSYDELYAHQAWFHSEILQRLGYANLEGFFHRTNVNKGLPIRGKISLVDNEELWIIEGPFGATYKESAPINEIPHCSSLNVYGDNQDELEVDKSADYEKLIRKILCEENSCSWVLFLAGEKMYLFERQKTLETRSFLEVTWPEVFSNKDTKVFKAIIGLFGYAAFKVVNGDIAHHQLAETAHREAHGVTKNLKDGVRDALELLINEALYYHRKLRPSKYLSKLEQENSNDEVAKILVDEGLRYLYRLLFLFFVESRGKESEILPIKSKGYSLGYSLENIRNLELKRISGAQQGNYIQKTLDKTFNIMFYGVELNRDETENLYSSGFECPKIGTLLFDPDKTPVLREVALRDIVMKEVISKLSITEMGQGKNKKMARISYANLGLNQLGAVYEGLLSLKPMIADDQYYTAVLGTKDEEFLIPRSDLKKFDKNQIQTDDENKPILHEKGDFLFRTMGYERKYSASFYTDEALTKCLVEECLEEHFKEDKAKPSCKKIEEMKILEPAMGSGAFLNETANQLAIYYADALVTENRHTKDVEQEVDGKKQIVKIEKERVELINEAKEYIMRHCLYGVDLNPMATELAKVSLWLNCIHKKGSFAFHDFKIRRGNSLVGASLRKKCEFNNNIYHFLVPIPEMIDSYIEACELKDKNRSFFNQVQIKRLNEVKISYLSASNHQERLEQISRRVTELYKIHINKRHSFQKEMSNILLNSSEIEILYLDYIKDNFEYRKLRSMMDYWCSLWLWDHRAIDALPSFENYLDDLKMIMDNEGEVFSNKQNIKKIIKSTPFFHYDLEFPEVFKSGGFDLILGNPPWVKLAWSDYDFFAELRPELLKNKPSSNKEYELFSEFLKNESVKNGYKKGLLQLNGIKKYLSLSHQYPLKDSSKTNTYKYFWQLSRKLTKDNGTYGLIKQNGILTDSEVEKLKEVYFYELSRLYRFVNELKLFDIGNTCEYVVAIFKKHKKIIGFDLIDSLYHPRTISKSRKASLKDDFPGKKNKKGDFNLSGHPQRMVPIDANKMKILTRLEGLDESEFLKIYFPKIYGQSEWKIIQKAALTKTHLGDVDYDWNQGFNETNCLKRKEISICKNEKYPIERIILTGPNVYVANPFSKQANPGCKNHRDFAEINLKEIDEDFFPNSKYHITNKGIASTIYANEFASSYRIIARIYVSTTGSRTLSSALYPPHISHIHSLCSIFYKNQRSTIILQAFLQSLIFDFYARNFGGSFLNKGSFWSKLPLSEINNDEMKNALILLTMRLNCLSHDYEQIWENNWIKEMGFIPSLMNYPAATENGKLNAKWKYDFALRDDLEREQVLCEIDALVAMVMGISCNDLIKLYRSEFGALQKKLKDLPAQNEEDSFPRAKLMAKAYQMFLDYFRTTEKEVVAGCFQNEEKSKEQAS